MPATTTYTISFVIGGFSVETVRVKYKANDQTTYTVLATLPNLAPGVTHTYTMPPLETHRMYTVILETVCEDSTFEFGGIRYLCNFICSPFTAEFLGGNSIDVEWECFVPQSSGDSVKEYRIEYRELGSTGPYVIYTVPIATVTSYWAANPGSYPFYTKNVTIGGISSGITYEVNHYTVIEYNFYGPSGTPTPIEVTINSTTPCSTTLGGESCPTCGPALGFVSSPTVDGIYVDDTSDFLFTRASGSFGSMFEQEGQACSPSSNPSGSFSDRTMTVASEKTFISDNPTGLASTISVFDNNTYLLLTTITLPYDPDNSLNITVRCNGITYSEVDGYVYFISNLYDVGVSTWRRLHRLDPVTYTITYNICGNLGPPAAYTTFLRQLFIHPITNVAYATNNLGLSYLVDLNMDTQVGTIPISPQSATFNTLNNEAWFFRQGASDITIYDGNTHTLIANVANGFGYLPKIGSVHGDQFTIAYYPGDGTAGSDRVFAAYQDAGNTFFYIVEYETSGPYVNTVFTSYPWASAPVNLVYAGIFNKLMFTLDNVVRAFAPTDGTTEYANVTITSLNPCRPVVDPSTLQIVYYSYGACPTDNVVWVGLDSIVADPCPEGIVELYVSGDGPYFWDLASLSWTPLCNTIVVGPVAGTFTVTATFLAPPPAPTVVKAKLEISTDGGTTWNGYEDQTATLYAIPALWALGRVYDDPGVAFIVRVSFATTTCSLIGAEV